MKQTSSNQQEMPSSNTISVMPGQDTIQEQLLLAGLTKNEAKVYLALLRLGKAKTGKIVEESRISSGKIYDTLQRLMHKGLAQESIENKTKHFIASKPHAVLAYLDEKKQELEEKRNQFSSALPALTALASSATQSESATTVLGFKGVQELIEDSLRAPGEFLIMGVRSSKNEKYNAFWMRWHRKRIAQKKTARVLFSDKGSDYYHFFKELKLTQVRSLVEMSPSALMIHGNEVFLFSYNQELFCIHITSSAIATSFASFFDGLWNIAKE